MIDDSGDDLERKSLAQLHELAARRSIPRFRTLRREQLIDALGGGGRRLEVDRVEELDEETLEQEHERMTGAPPGQPLGAPLHAEVERERPRRGRRRRLQVDRVEELDKETLEEEEHHDRMTGGPPGRPLGAPLHADLDEQEGEDEEGGEAAEEPASLEQRSGVLDIVPDGFGFLRVEGFSRSPSDVYVSRSQVRSLGLRQGDELSGPVRASRRGERHPSLVEVEQVNGEPLDARQQERRSFDSLTPILPDDRLTLAHEPSDISIRMVELVAPLGKGQRCIVSGAPGAGATTLLKQIVSAAAAAGGIVPIVLLIDVRPEEVTDWARSLDVPVHASPSDRSADAHAQFAVLALERARRLVEDGAHVLLAVDSLTRLARSHALSRAAIRRVDGDEEAGEAFGAQQAKRFFAAARNTEEGGSLTIVGIARSSSALPTEDVLHEALADAANAELRLDSGLAEKGLRPALDVRRSYARGDSAGEESLRRLHGSLEALPAAHAWEQLAERIRDSRSNEDLLAAVWGLPR